MTEHGYTSGLRGEDYPECVELYGDHHLNENRGKYMRFKTDAEAAARLNAAAPDLLEACKKVVNILPRDTFVHIDRIHAAIAKAEGEHCD